MLTSHVTMISTCLGENSYFALYSNYEKYDPIIEILKILILEYVIEWLVNKEARLLVAF